PELQARLNSNEHFSHKALHIELQCGDERIYLDYEQHQLTVSSACEQANAYQNVAVDERELISYIIFGYCAPAEADENTSILQVLFPKQNAVFHLTDKF